MGTCTPAAHPGPAGMDARTAPIPPRSQPVHRLPAVLDRGLTVHPLEAAERYVARGWPVVPVAKGSKRPTCKWKDLQARLNTPEELQAAFGNNGVNVSIVTGAFSGLVVLDADSEHGKAELEKLLPDGLETPICKTARGWHYYFKHPGNGQKIPSKPLIEGPFGLQSGRRPRGRTPK